MSRHSCANRGEDHSDRRQDPKGQGTHGIFRCRETAANDARCRPNDRAGNHGLRCRYRELPQGARLCRVAGSCAPAALFGRQGATWPGIKGRPERYTAFAHYRSNVTAELDGAAIYPNGIGAYPGPGPQASNAGRDCAGKHPSHTCKHVLPGSGWRARSGPC